MRLRPLGQLVGFFRKIRLSEVLSRPQIVRMSTDVVPEAKMDIATTDKSPADADQPIDLSTVKEDVGAKRPNEEEEEGGAAAKKPKTEGEEEEEKHSRPYYKKKKVAMLVIYSGKGYTGMQMNPGMKTIEQDLLDAFSKAGIVTEDHASKPGTKMGFQRAARTDKGVSAAGQVVSLKMFVDVENAIEKINSHLADQIRAIGFKRVTRGFSSKDSCSSRTYIYLLPTFAFTPVEEFVTDNFKMSEKLREEINSVFALYKGTHNFHNFTSGKKPTDPSAQRYIMDMKIGEPFMKEKVEFAVISIKGQSFMLHQIRKMIGLAMAIVRGLATTKSLEYAWRPEKADVPVAPGLGLMLDQLHYDAYNKRYGQDGMHEAIVWDEYKDQIEEFKHKYIFNTIIETEKKERSMMKWLATLHNHHFEPRKDEHQSVRAETKLGQASNNIRKLELGIPLSESSAAEGSPAEGSPAKVSPTEGSPTEASPAKGSPTEGSPTEASPTEGSPTEVPMAEGLAGDEKVIQPKVEGNGDGEKDMKKDSSLEVQSESTPKQIKPEVPTSSDVTPPDTSVTSSQVQDVKTSD